MDLTKYAHEEEGNREKGNKRVVEPEILYVPKTPEIDAEIVERTQNPDDDITIPLLMLGALAKGTVTGIGINFGAQFLQKFDLFSTVRLNKVGDPQNLFPEIALCFMLFTAKSIYDLGKK